MKGCGIQALDQAGKQDYKMAEWQDHGNTRDANFKRNHSKYAYVAIYMTEANVDYIMWHKETKGQTNMNAKHDEVHYTQTN